MDINRKNIGELRVEIDSIKMQIHRCSVQIEDILRDTDGVKRMCANREAEIASQMASNQELDAKNDQLSEENKAEVNRVRQGSLRSRTSRMNATAATSITNVCTRRWRRASTP